jgi:hypothetical protein
VKTTREVAQVLNISAAALRAHIAAGHIAMPARRAGLTYLWGESEISQARRELAKPGRRRPHWFREALLQDEPQERTKLDGEFRGCLTYFEFRGRIPGTPYLFRWRIEGGVSRYPWNREAAPAFKSKGRRVSRIVGRAFCRKLPARAQEETPAGLGPRGTDRAGHR